MEREKKAMTEYKRLSEEAKKVSRTLGGTGKWAWVDLQVTYRLLNMLNTSRDIKTVKAALAELEDAGLIVRDGDRIELYESESMLKTAREIREENRAWAESGLDVWGQECGW